jgi:hypothetical protein
MCTSLKVMKVYKVLEALEANITPKYIDILIFINIFFYSFCCFVPPHIKLHEYFFKASSAKNKVSNATDEPHLSRH